jgi:hypothetical protein
MHFWENGCWLKRLELLEKEENGPIMHCTRLARGVVAVVQSIVSILLGIWNWGLLPLSLEGTVVDGNCQLA